jgi:hypothetical protein
VHEEVETALALDRRRERTAVPLVGDVARDRDDVGAADRRGEDLCIPAVDDDPPPLGIEGTGESEAESGRTSGDECD